MITEMLKLELRKIGPYYGVCLGLMAGFILFYNRPLAISNFVITAIAVIQGGVLAWWIFDEPGDTGSFIFSRPLSRRRLFMMRWTLGISLQLLTGALVFLLIASGLRSGVQIGMGSPYYPMVKWFELEILWSVCLFSLLGYGVQMFLKLRSRVLATQPRGEILATWSRGKVLLARSQRLIAISAPLFVIALTLFLIIWLCLQPIVDEVGLYDAMNVEPRLATLGLLIYVAIVTLLVTAASARCYRRLEVEA